MNDFVKMIELEIEEAGQLAEEARIKYNTLVELLAKYKKSYGLTNGSKPQIALPAIGDRKVTSSSGSEADGNKTQKVMAVIIKNQWQGVKAGEVVASLNAAGVSIRRNYVYSILNRLKKRGEIQDKKGKYYPSEATTLGSAAREVPKGSAV